MKKSVIVAIGNNREIGLDNKLLWHLPEDLKMFKKHTMNCPIIMGRKTFESIGRPLPGRENVIITRNKNLQIEGCTVVHSLSEAFSICADKEANEAFVIGGGEIYKEALSVCDRLYLSQVDYTGDADTFFPAYESLNWKRHHFEEFAAVDDKPKWSFSILDKS